jgi:hypothetical protein
VSLAARVKRLERARGAGRPCAGRITSIVLDDQPIPPDAPRCRRCGERHILRLRTVVVKAPGEEGGGP